MYIIDRLLQILMQLSLNIGLMASEGKVSHKKYFFFEFFFIEGIHFLTFSLCLVADTLIRQSWPSATG